MRSVSRAVIVEIPLSIISTHLHQGIIKNSNKLLLSSSQAILIKTELRFHIMCDSTILPNEFALIFLLQRTNNWHGELMTVPLGHGSVGLYDD